MIAIAIGIAFAIDGRHAEFLDSDPDSDRDSDPSPLIAHTPIFGHTSANTHSSQLGDRAEHTRRP